jgi:MerR family transcriptional regulator, aldehyde-responsive regulator
VQRDLSRYPEYSEEAAPFFLDFELLSLTWSRLQVLYCLRGEMMKIAEVSERYGISADTLRYYERIGLIPPVNRNERGIRDYGEIDLRRVEFIKCMRSAGLPIETLIEYVGLVQQGDQTNKARKEILIEQREQLLTRMAEMQKTLDILDYKISMYENAVLKREQELLPIED